MTTENSTKPPYLALLDAISIAERNAGLLSEGLGGHDARPGAEAGAQFRGRA